jgi:hypothetical protein
VKRTTSFTFDGMNACHPITKTDLGWKFPVRATADADSDGSGNVTLYFEAMDGGGLYFSGPSAERHRAADEQRHGVPVRRRARPTRGHHVRQGLMWHKAALERVYIKLDDADGAGVMGKTMTEKNTGMSMRYTKQWDINSRSGSCGGTCGRRSSSCGRNGRCAWRPARKGLAVSPMAGM